MPSTIRSIDALEILDSRGVPTIQAILTLAGGQRVIAAVPSGKSTGRHEAHERRDADPKRYGGQGVTQAVRAVRGPIAKLLRGKSVVRQDRIDRLLIDLDGTPDKHFLGANAILAASLAVARARAVSRKLPLYRSLSLDAGQAKSAAKTPAFPRLLFNVINGGLHADNGITFQEFFLIPTTREPQRALEVASAVVASLRDVLVRQRCSTLVGDEGGFAPHAASVTQPLQWLHDATARAGFRAGVDVTFGLDVAASTFWQARERTYVFATEGRTLTPTQLIAFYRELAEKYHLTVIEDGLDEDAWADWSELTRQLGRALTLVGDDLFVTNVERLRQGIDAKAANAILIKLNQIGTLTETLDAIRVAREHAYAVVISNRSGETVDPFIADLAVAVRADALKAGGLMRGERLAKYNRLLEIAAGLA